MQNLRVAPELRSPQSLMRDLRRKSAHAEVVVALALVLSICAIVYAIADGPIAAAWALNALA